MKQVPRGFTEWTQRNAARIEAARERGTLPYFLKDNARLMEREAEAKTLTLARAKARHEARSEKEEAEIRRRWETFRTYQAYKRNGEYRDMRFNHKTGAFMSTHKEHNLDKKRGWYETTVQKAGFDAGHCVVLGREDHTKLNVRNTDGTWDGLKFEVAAAETATPNNIRNALKYCASKPECEVAVVFFPKGYSDALFEDGLGKYRGLKGTTQYKSFERIIAIHEGRIVQQISRMVE